MSAVTGHMAAQWNEANLPTLLSNYKLENIFNADKFGMFYQCHQLKRITYPEKSVLAICNKHRIL